ncbi:GNAT family N-acetyltransferase [Actinosynnema sp. CS-041913]|uniref:GNAT family N-acetyltransferase n=1 Tax=Actinosynnema sp. CS-041913 TaxID=3239917 RepID=UPI003D903ABA
MGSGEYVLRTVGAAELARMAVPLERLYRGCFADPPWSEGEEQFAAFPDRLACHLGTAGAHGVAAWAGVDLAGVVYGWPAAAGVPDSRFYAGVFGAVDESEHRRLRSPALEVAELMVDAAHRGRGLGRELLRRFVAGHAPAWLCVHAESRARAFYESAGWVVRGRFTVADDVPLLVMTLDGGPA